MNNEHIWVIIMAGGLGSRFWPVSSVDCPKQFVDTMGVGRSMLQLTFERMEKICPRDHIVVVTGEQYTDRVREQVPGLMPWQVLGEPLRRNTAPCIAYGAAVIAQMDPEATVIVSPSDHAVFGLDRFVRNLTQAIDCVQEHDWIITVGVQPVKPDTSYGYIQFREPAAPKGVQGVQVITRVEKYGFFVSLSKSVYGLLRSRNPKEKVGNKIVVKISEIKPHKGKMDVDLTYSKTKYGSDYEIIKVKRNVKRTRIADLSEDNLGRNVAIQGEIIQIQQTSGPTIFTVRDETDVTWAAAFNEPGVRMYPDLEVEDVVEILGEVSLHGGKIQIESENIEKLEDDEEENFKKIVSDAMDKKAEPEDTSVMVESEILDLLRPKLALAAKAIRKAILDGRSILVRHHADADGICAGVAVEQAVLPLLREESNDADAEWHFFKRSPSKAPFYELEDVVKDLSYALEDAERHGQKLPLLVLLDNGSTEEDVAALRHSKVYGIESIVVDHHYPGEVENGRALIDDYVDIHVNPYLVGGDSQLTAGALAVELAGMINPDVRPQIRHFPGIAAVGDHAECDEVDQYLAIAEEEGYSREDLDKVATCVDFEAYFLRFMNGRGVMNTILGLEDKERQEELLDVLMSESDKRVETQLKAAMPNVETVYFENGIQLNRLDVEKYAHKFTYPAPGKTTGYVHDKLVQEKSEDEPIMTLANGPDFAVLRATEVIKNEFEFNLNNVITKIQEEIPQAGADGGGHEVAGSLKFVEGLQEEVLNLFIEEVKNLKR